MTRLEGWVVTNDVPDWRFAQDIIPIRNTRVIRHSAVSLVAITAFLLTADP